MPCEASAWSGFELSESREMWPTGMKEREVGSRDLAPRVMAVSWIGVLSFGYLRRCWASFISLSGSSSERI